MLLKLNLKTKYLLMAVFRHLASINPLLPWVTLVNLRHWGPGSPFPCLAQMPSPLQEGSLIVCSVLRLLPHPTRDGPRDS